MKRIFLTLMLALLMSVGCAGTATASMDHIVWVLGENTPRSVVIQNSYFKTLASQEGDVQNLKAITHPSLPNYLAMTGGSTFGVTDDSNPSSHPIKGQSIFGQTSGRSLEESMPSNCALTSSGTYAVRHNPATYYVDERTLCGTNDIPYKTGTLPNLSAPFTFVTPNLCDDAHDLCGASNRAGAIAHFATYVQKFLAQAKLTTQWTTQKTAIVITFDEGSGSNQTIYTVVVSNQKGHVTNTQPATLYTLLGTTEDLLGKPRLRSAATAGTLTTVFQ